MKPILFKPDNPYPKGTTIWSIFEGDWEDLTIAQIAEVLDVHSGTVWSSISKIKKDTGYDVPRTKAKAGRKVDE